MRRAKGDIVAWLNSDDYYLPGAIQSAVAAFESNPQAVMVYGNMLAVDQTGQTINQLRYRQLTLEDLLCFQIIGQPTVFIRRAAFEKAGGLDINFHFMLDHQLWIKLAAQGPIVHVNQTWSAARYHPLAKNRAQAPGFAARLSAFWIGRKPNLIWLRYCIASNAAPALRLNVSMRATCSTMAKHGMRSKRGAGVDIHPPTALRD